MEIRIIDKAHEADIRLPNESFPLFARIIPTYDGAVWRWRQEDFPPEQVTEMCFPDEAYDFDAMADSVFLGAYEIDRCIGLAVLQPYYFGYMYLMDLKVLKSCRGKGAGKALIEKAGEIAAAQDYRGIYTVGQDNNAAACLFYLHNGFVIGGLDTNIYKGSKQEGKADILFYRDTPPG